MNCSVCDNPSAVLSPTGKCVDVGACDRFRQARHPHPRIESMEDAEGELGILLCARVAHEANRAYCISLGDPSQVYFDDAPQWQRDSAITGVRGVLRGNGSRESHESWLKEKLNAGWTYGPVKDADKKTHPCFVHYDDLPPAQRKKDEIFVGVVRVMAAALGLPLATCSCEGQRPFEPIRSMTELLDEAARCSIHGKKENE